MEQVEPSEDEAMLAVLGHWDKGDDGNSLPLSSVCPSGLCF